MEPLELRLHTIGFNISMIPEPSEMISPLMQSPYSDLELDITQIAFLEGLAIPLNLAMLTLKTLPSQMQAQRSEWFLDTGFKKLGFSKKDFGIFYRCKRFSPFSS